MPITARIALLLVLGLALTAETPPFLVGVVRSDGVVIPFAAFDGKNWTRPWPEDVEPDDIPDTLQIIPRDWWGKTGRVTELTAWANGVSRGVIQLHLGRPVRLHVMCDERLGLQSTYSPPVSAPPQTVQPYPKDGLAVSGDLKVDAIRSIDPKSDEWAAAAREMTAEFDAAEDRAARTFTAWKHPFSKVERRRYVPRIEAMYGAPMDEAGWNAYYIETVRLYPPGPEDRGCGLVTSASGWMKAGPNNKRSFDFHARITYCDREGVGYMLPLGVIEANQRRYWAYQISGYGRESYLIVRPRPKEIVPEVVYTAGLCNRRPF